MKTGCGITNVHEKQRDAVHVEMWLACFEPMLEYNNVFFAVHVYKIQENLWI
jgi:hypothetical protein